MMKNSMKLNHRVILSLCALFFFIGVISVHAATYYVATTGNDSNPGTVSQPFRSIARGVGLLDAGDTLYIRTGTWTEAINLTGKTGTPGNYITIAGYPGETVTSAGGDPMASGSLYGLNQAYFIIENIVFDGVNAGDGTFWSVGNGAHDIIIRNNEIKRWHGHGILVSKSPSGNKAGSNISIVNNHIHDQISATGVAGTRWYGIYFHSSDGSNLIEGNDIHNNPGGGIQAYPGPTSNLVIRNNKIHHNNTLASSPVGGILLQGSTGAVITNTQIYNNVVYNNGSAAGAGTASGIQINQYTNGTKVWNNTSYGNNNVGIVVGPDAIQLANTVVQNNISYNNNGGNYINLGVNTTADHNLTANPNFVNAAAFNFNLQISSPAIDAGVILSQVKMDIKNAPRPQGTTHDIGAYEGGAGSDISPPRSPTGLTIN